MGRGLGATQRRLLDAIRASRYDGRSTTELSELLSLDGRQTRRAVVALRDRGLVYTRLIDSGWRGYNEYGPSVQLAWRRDGSDWRETVFAREAELFAVNGQRAGYRGAMTDAYDKSALLPGHPGYVLSAGDPWPGRPGHRVRVGSEVLFVKLGMPQGISMMVWSIEDAGDMLEAVSVLRSGGYPSWYPGYQEVNGPFGREVFVAALGQRITRSGAYGHPPAGISQMDKVILWFEDLEDLRFRLGGSGRPETDETGEVVGELTRLEAIIERNS